MIVPTLTHLKPVILAFNSFLYSTVSLHPFLLFLISLVSIWVWPLAFPTIWMLLIAYSWWSSIHSSVPWISLIWQQVLRAQLDLGLIFLARQQMAWCLLAEGHVMLGHALVCGTAVDQIPWCVAVTCAGTPNAQILFSFISWESVRKRCLPCLPRGCPEVQFI